MPSVNKAEVIGHLGKDPEMKMTKTGKNVCKFSIATSERWTEGGEWKEKTTWHDIVCWGKIAETAYKSLHKGDCCRAEGPIHNRSWDKKDGTKGYRTEISAYSIKNFTYHPDTETKPEPVAEPAKASEQEEDLPF